MRFERASDDFLAAVDSDLLGRLLRTPTVYQRIRGPSAVALLYLYHGASIYSTIGSAALFHLAGAVIEGAASGATSAQRRFVSFMIR